MTTVNISGSTNDTNLVLNSASATITDDANTSALVEMKELIKEMDYLASYDDTLYTLTAAGAVDWSNNNISDYVLHNSPQAGALLTQRDIANWMETVSIKLFRAPWSEAFGFGMEPHLTIPATESWDLSQIKLNLVHLRNQVINSLPSSWPTGATVTSETNLSFSDFVVKFQKYPLGVDKYEDFKAYGNGIELSLYKNDFCNDKFGGIFTKNAYTNYIFECDFEFLEIPDGQNLRGGPAKQMGLDSGILFHAQPPNTMVTRNYPIPDGHKSVQVNCGAQIIMKLPVNSGMAIFGDVTMPNPSAASASVVVNLHSVVVKYKIVCENDTAKIYYDDLLGHELTGLDRSSGHIGFQSEGRSDFRVTNMKLKPLP